MSQPAVDAGGRRRGNDSVGNDRTDIKKNKNKKEAIDPSILVLSFQKRNHTSVVACGDRHSTWNIEWLRRRHTLYII
jgi:hypothetical protein